MKTYEYSVSSERADGCGLATVQSVCADIINAISRNFSSLDEGSADNGGLMLLRSEFEIDERPKAEDNYNISVWTVMDSPARFSKCIRVTDYDGSEIGRGTTEWCKVDPEAKMPFTNFLPCYINSCCDLLPEETLSSGLSVRLNFDFNDEPSPEDEVAFGLKRRNDENYLFYAKSGDRTLCKASITTE